MWKDANSEWAGNGNRDGVEKMAALSTTSATLACRLGSSFTFHLQVTLVIIKKY